MHRQIEDVRSIGSQERLHQIEIFDKAAIGLPQVCVDTRIFHRAEDLSCETRFGKGGEDGFVI